MNRLCVLVTGLAVVFSLSAVPTLAQHGGHGGGGGMGPGPMDTRGNSERDRGKGMSGTNEPNTGAMTQGKKTPDELLTQNTKLASKLQSLLPAGINLQAAARGFKNLGLFVAAVHVSHNLGIPFDELKAKIVGGASLGKAIHTLKPEANAPRESRKAKTEADKDIKES